VAAASLVAVVVDSRLLLFACHYFMADLSPSHGRRCRSTYKSVDSSSLVAAVFRLNRRPSLLVAVAHQFHRSNFISMSFSLSGAACSLGLEQ
jgi:hypothetical protein